MQIPISTLYIKQFDTFLLGKLVGTNIFGQIILLRILRNSNLQVNLPKRHPSGEFVPLLGGNFVLEISIGSSLNCRMSEVAVTRRCRFGRFTCISNYYI